MKPRRDYTRALQPTPVPKKRAVAEVLIFCAVALVVSLFWGWVR